LSSSSSSSSTPPLQPPPPPPPPLPLPLPTSRIYTDRFVGNNSGLKQTMLNNNRTESNQMPCGNFYSVSNNERKFD
jgi:hypothetical protein